MAEADDLLLEEWLGVLAELWTAAGKPLEADRLQVYRQSLGEVPLGLLELAVRRVIRENVVHVVPLPGVVWAAVRRLVPRLTPESVVAFDRITRARGRCAGGGVRCGEGKCSKKDCVP